MSAPVVRDPVVSTAFGLTFEGLGRNGRIDRIFLAIISSALLGKLTDSLLGLFGKWAIAKWA